MFYDSRNKFSDGEDYSDRGMDFQEVGALRTNDGEGEEHVSNNKKKKKSKKDKSKGKQQASDHFKKAGSSFDSPTRTEEHGHDQEIAFSPGSPGSSAEPEAFWQEGVPEPHIFPRSPQRDPSGSFRRGAESVSSSDETGLMERNRTFTPPDIGPRRPSRTVSPVPHQGETPEAIILNTFVDDDEEDGRNGSCRDDLTISTDEAQELCREEGDDSSVDQGNRSRGLSRSRSRASADSRTFSSDSTFDEAFTTGSERSSSSSYEENSVGESGSGTSSYEERSIRDAEEGRAKNDVIYQEMDPQQRRNLTLTLIAVIISWCLVGIIAGGIVGTILKG